MTYDEARQSLVGYFNAEFSAAFPGVPVEYDNRNLVDLEAQAAIGPFLELAVLFDDSTQASFGAPVLERTTGMMQVIVHAPVGSGSANANEILEWVKRRMRRLNLPSGVQTSGARRSSAGEIPGFSSEALLVGFWYDDFG